MKPTLFALLSTLALLPLAGNADEKISGRELTKVTTSTGVIEKTSPNTWVKRGDNGTVFQFEEIGAFPMAVTLRDESRNVVLTLSVIDSRVFVSDLQGNHFPRATILKMESTTLKKLDHQLLLTAK